MEIQEIKQQLTIGEVLAHYQLRPTAKGALQCPFPCHPNANKGSNGQSRKKTLQVYTDTNRYQCFHSECKAGNGDVIDFIEQMERCGKHAAIEKAKQLIGPDKARPSSGTKTLITGNGTPVISDAHSDVGVKPTGSRPEGDEPPGGTFGLRDNGQAYYLDGCLEITVLGGIGLENLDRMRCTLKLLSVAQPLLPAIRHSIDLYHDDQLNKLVRKAAERLELGTSKIAESLYALTDHLEAYRLAELEQQQQKEQPKKSPISERERQRAIGFLKGAKLMERTNSLLGESGIVGESTNRQILWLVYGSRKRAKPLHVICLGASGTGKTYLQEKVARFVPEDEKFSFTASSENAFYYLEPYDLCHKVVLVEDMDGAQYLLYPLRELQTKHWISKIVPVKDQRGQMGTRKLEVFGPICLSGTTTKEKLYEDNANRCLLLHLDNSSEQREKIMDYQRKLSAGKVDSRAEMEATALLGHIQEVLKPIRVINPYAEALKIPEQCFKPLRTNEHYLQFIETVSWYHQYQREEKADTETGEVYIETTLEDIAIANKLMKEVLLTKSDELPKGVREFFEQLKEWLKKEGQTSFYVKALRSAFRLYPMKAHRYIRTLEQYGHLKQTGGNKKQGYEYEVTDWGDYDRLKEGLDILDELLESLKKGGS